MIRMEEQSNRRYEKIRKRRRGMNIINLCLIAITGVITAVIIKGFKQEFSILIMITLSMIFFSWMLGVFYEIYDQFESIISELEQNKSFYKILFKIVGITYICEFSSGICKDAGYSSIASQIEIMGKMLVFLSGVPVLVSVIETIRNYEV